MGGGHLSASRKRGAETPTSFTTQRHYKSRAKLCGLAGVFCTLALDRLLAADVYPDLLRLRFGLLGQADLQHAFVVVSGDVFRIHCLRQAEAASEAPILTLHTTEILFFLFLLELTLAVHGEGVVLDADVEVFLIDPRDFDLQVYGVLIFIDIHCRA